MAIRRDRQADSDDLGRKLYGQNLWLRDLLAAVADDLERLAARPELATAREALLARAMRIRQRLHESRRP